MTAPTTPATEGAPEAVEYRGKVRPRDRETSWDAASAQTNDKTGALQVLVYEALRGNGPMTHGGIISALSRDGHAITESGVRTRTAELLHAGWVRAVEGRKGVSPTGRPATLWRAVLDGEPAPIVQPPLPSPPATPKTATLDHAEGILVARRWAAWEIGDASWADRIVEAYLEPERIGKLLDGEGAP